MGTFNLGDVFAEETPVTIIGDGTVKNPYKIENWTFEIWRVAVATAKRHTYEIDGLAIYFENYAGHKVVIINGETGLILDND